MKSIKYIIMLTSAASLLALSGCNSKENASASKEVVVATVNGKVISQKSIDMIVKQGADAGRSDSPEARKAIVDQMTMQMLVADEAVKKGLDKSPEVLDQIELIKTSILANAYVQDYIKNNPVSDTMLKAEYDKIKAGITGVNYKARHILVATEAEANGIIAKLKKDPASFEKIAMDKSLDTGSKVKGGDLGWFDPSKMVPEFSAAVAKLDKGKFTETPVKTQFGYHVILLEDSKPIEAPPFEEVKSHLAQSVQQKNLQKQLDDIKAKAKIEIAPAPAPAK